MSRVMFRGAETVALERRTHVSAHNLINRKIKGVVDDFLGEKKINLHYDLDKQGDSVYIFVFESDDIIVLSPLKNNLCDYLRSKEIDFRDVHFQVKTKD